MVYSSLKADVSSATGGLNEGSLQRYRAHRRYTGEQFSLPEDLSLPVIDVVCVSGTGVIGFGDVEVVVLSRMNYDQYGGV